MHDDDDQDTSELKPTNDDELVWSGRPSQWVNLPINLMLISAGTAVIYGRDYFYSSELDVLIRNLTYRFGLDIDDYMYLFDYLCLSVLVLILIKICHRILTTYYTRYELTNERLIEFTGISRAFENGEPLELYKVYDYQFPPALFLALCRRGSLRLLTTDARQPIVDLYAIKNRRSVYEQIRQKVEALRISKKGYFNDGPR